MIITAGMDVGSSSVKTVILSRADGEGPPDLNAARASAGGPSPSTRLRMTGVDDDNTDVLVMRTDRIRRRDLRKVIEESYEAALTDAGIQSSDVAYLATTGEGELVEFRRGHFYGMTTHARGAIFLMPDARAALDIGALHARALRMDEKSRVLSYRMTSQCASGSGQFLENVARYLGITLEDIGPLSCSASDPEMVSSICAVLAETDVINMVSRGIKTHDILKGIHLSMAGRYLKLLRSIGAEGTVAITGGLSADVGLAKALREKVAEEKLPMEIVTDPRAIYAGALGAALWGAYRHEVLARRSVA
ncbi:MAG: benzoyl-CoA reductase subunit D [Thermoanaerobaculia bacterium]